MNSESVFIDANSFDSPTDLKHMDYKVLLFQTGYLTFASEANLLGYILKFPNFEIKQDFASILFTEKMRHDDDSGITSTLTTKLSSLETAKDIVAYFNQILNIVDNEHNPLTQESMVVSIINVFLYASTQHYIGTNTHSLKGRADLIIDEKDRRIVCEFKYAKNDSPVEALLNRAIEQITEKEYGNTPLIHSNVVKLALVYSKEQRKILAYKEV